MISLAHILLILNGVLREFFAANTPLWPFGDMPAVVHDDRFMITCVELGLFKTTGWVRFRSHPGRVQF